MKKYIIKFYYYTDLRCHSSVKASNEVCALMKAMEQHGFDHWVGIDDGFHIIIEPY